MSILVTGGAGFIGSHLVEHLLATTKSQVVCLDNFNDYYDPAIKRTNVARLFGEKRVALVRADFCDEAEITAIIERHEVDQIVHLGGYPGVRYSVENPRVYQEVNLLGTLSILEAARKFEMKRVVVVSSSTVYGSGAKAPFAEDANLGVPLSPYGVSKRAAELLAFNYHELHQVPAVCLRLFSVYGPRLRPDLAMTIFADAITQGQPLKLHGDGSVKRDFTHVSDICRGICAALETRGIEGQAFNLGHDQPIAISEVIQTLERHLGSKAIVHRQAPRSEDMPITHADLTKSKKVLGYVPRVSFEEGCADYCRWFLASRQVARRAA